MQPGYYGAPGFPTLAPGEPFAMDKPTARPVTCLHQATSCHPVKFVSEKPCTSVRVWPRSDQAGLCRLEASLMDWWLTDWRNMRRWGVDRLSHDLTAIIVLPTNHPIAHTLPILPTNYPHIAHFANRLPKHCLPLLTLPLHCLQIHPWHYPHIAHIATFAIISSVSSFPNNILDSMHIKTKETGKNSLVQRPKILRYVSSPHWQRPIENIWPIWYQVMWVWSAHKQDFQMLGVVVAGATFLSGSSRMWVSEGDKSNLVFYSSLFYELFSPEPICRI